ncbi:MAG: ornithine cyclodeaminase/alanine dehydrogenase-like protein (mu-crystallin family) [Colwellia sp.]|jgi:ornithine cyclodeaminase/alanine dehydrogenase-like protein (mu-crystallin family)
MAYYRLHKDMLLLLVCFYIYCEAIENLKNYIHKADIISCATLNTQALFFGQ